MFKLFGGGKKKDKINVIVVGANGMLGYDMVDRLKHSVDCDRIGQIHCITRLNVDATNLSALLDYVSDLKSHYDYVINCAAYTDTIGCEQWDNRRKSYEENALIPLNLAKLCNRFGMKLYHVSTNEVFSESITNIPTTKLPNPTSVYGLHKYMGENFIMQEMKKENYGIFRTSWLYGDHGHNSFVHKATKAIMGNAKYGSPLFGVTDEYSIPTPTRYLAAYMRASMLYGLSGIFHATAYGMSASRYEYLCQILSIYHSIGMFDEVSVDSIQPISSVQPCLRRIMRVVLERSELPPGLLPAPWKTLLCNFIMEYGDRIVKWAEDECREEKA